MRSSSVLLPLAAGAFDLSVGTMLALGMVLTTWLNAQYSMNPLLAGAIAILACAAVGLVNGFIVSS
jgi:ribose transport system permease protein